jgi:hypothetical protein
MKTLAILLCAALFIAVGFSGCVLPIEKTTGTGDDGTGAQAQGNETSALKEGETNDIMQPAAENNVLYMHANEKDRWMNALEKDSDASLQYIGHTYIGTGNGFGATFKLAPSTKNDVLLDTNKKALVSLLLQVETTNVQYTINAALHVGGAEFGSDEEVVMLDSGTKEYSFSLAVPSKISYGAEISLFVSVHCPAEMTIPTSTRVNLYLDGSSTLTLPIVSPIYTGADGNNSGSASSSKSSSGDRNANIDESTTSASIGSDGKWHAAKTVTITNDFGGASHCDLTMSTVVGYTNAKTWSESGYKFVATLEGKGDSEKEARTNLEALSVIHDDSLSGGTLDLSVTIENSQGSWNNQEGDIEAYVPSSPSFTVDAESTVGLIRVSGLHGDKLTADTTTGTINCESDFDSLGLQATTGSINVEIASKASGNYDISTTTGAISLNVKNMNEYGYDVTADATTGSISINLSNTESVGDQSDDHKHVKTTNYDSKAIKITMDIETTTGTISVGD